MKFAQSEFLWLLLLFVPGLAVFFYWSWRTKQALIRQFVSARLLNDLTVGVLPGRQIFRLVLLCAALLFAFLALARPQWGFDWEEAKQIGLDIVVVMDTSRSMLVQDVSPNRLERAKLAAFDLMNQAKSDRLGLVPFAGNAFLQTPLTLDDQAFRQGLDAINVGIIPEGGTAISTAIHTAMQSFEKGNDNHKVIVLFTDGEDHDTDTETMAAANDAAKEGVHIFTVGVGTREGDLIRVRDEQGNFSYVKNDEGNVVKSQLNEALLQKIATATGGFYLPLVGPNPMQTLYARGIAPLPKGESTSRMTKAATDRYHWFLAIAMLCLIIEYVLPERPRRSRRAPSSILSTTTQKVVAAVAFCLVFLNASGSPSSAYHDYQSGNYKSSSTEYNRLAEKDTNDYRLHYDAGTSAYKAKDLETAEKQFNATLNAPGLVRDLPTEEHTFYNLGNTEYRLGEPMSDADKKQERWQAAIDAYTQALHLNTNDLDARNNLSYVEKRLEELKRQQQQQQQQNNKQNKNQKNQQNQQNQDNARNKQDQNNQKNQQKQNQQNQNQEQARQNQQNKQDKDGQDQQKQQDQQQKDQARRDQEKQRQQQESAANSEKKDGQQPDQQQEEQAVPGQMSPKEARQILAEERDDEKALIFSPENKPVKTQVGKIKDW